MSVVILNLADPKTVSNKDAQTMASNCNVQLLSDVAAVWLRRFSPTVFVANKQPKDLPPRTQYIAIVDSLDDPGALGEHFDEADGTPAGLVGVQPILVNGGDILAGPLSVQTVLSHERIELALNGWVNVWVDAPDGYSYPQEGADAVEADSYMRLGCAGMLSNFVRPEWFEGERDQSAPVDFMGLLPRAASFTIRPTGYTMRRSTPADVEQVGGARAAQRDLPEAAHGLLVERVYGAEYPEWRKRVHEEKARLPWLKSARLGVSVTVDLARGAP
jgi:hypothetical protein